MNIPKTAKPPHKTKRRSATRPQIASRTREGNHVIPLGLATGIVAAMRTKKKVRFRDLDTAIDGFDLLEASGYPVEVCGQYTYGIVSDRQLALLKDAKIPYESVA